MGRAIRIALLLLILVTVAQEAWLARSRATTWNDPLRVAIYPLNGDGSKAAADYLRQLRPETFEPIERFFAEESRRHGLDIHRPLRLTLAPPIAVMPPPPPQAASALDAILWSLQMRWWAWHYSTGTDKPQVRMYVLFFDADRNPRLPHSVGLDRGMIGVVNAFASDEMAGSNNVVIAHELLHTLGATDKYDPANNLPRFPEGYAAPERNPRHPQEFAEIMAGRIPRSPALADIPDSLDQTVIGTATAAEIRWRKTP